MAHSARAPELIDVETYLERERSAEIRREYVGGRPYAMVGTSDAHNLIALNLAAAMHRHLRGGPCQLFISGMKVRLRIAGEEIFYYPDLLVSCRLDDRARYWGEHPCLVVEIASPYTDRIDRREKLLAYREIQALEEYLLVEQDRKGLTLLRRAEAWQPRDLGETDTLVLAPVGLEIPVRDLYEGVGSARRRPLRAAGCRHRLHCAGGSRAPAVTGGLVGSTTRESANRASFWPARVWSDFVGRDGQ